MEEKTQVKTKAEEKREWEEYKRQNDSDIHIRDGQHWESRFDVLDQKKITIKDRRG